MNNKHGHPIGTEIGCENGPNVRLLLDVEEVSSLLHCSTRHVYRLVDDGKMPKPVKLGSLVRWNRVAIDNWIIDGCKPVRLAKGGRRR